MSDFNIDLPVSEFPQVPACASDGSTLELEEQVAEDLAVDTWMNTWMAKYERPAFAGGSQLWRTAALSAETKVAAVGIIAILPTLLALWREVCNARIKEDPGKFGFLRPIVEEVQGIEESLRRNQTEVLLHSAQNLGDLAERLLSEAANHPMPLRGEIADAAGSLNFFAVAIHVERGDFRVALASVKWSISNFSPDMRKEGLRGELGKQLLPQIIRAEEGRGYRLFAKGDLREARDAFSHALEAYQLLAENPESDVAVARARVELMRDALLYHAEGKVNFPEALEGDLIMKTFAASNLQTALHQYLEIIKTWPLSTAPNTAHAHFRAGLARLCLDIAQLATGKDRKEEYRLRAGTYLADAAFIFLQLGKHTDSKTLLDLAIDTLPDKPWADAEIQPALRTNLSVVLSFVAASDTRPRFIRAMQLWQTDNREAAATEARKILELLDRALEQLKKIKRTLMSDSVEREAVAQVEWSVRYMTVHATYFTEDERLKTRYREQATACAPIDPALVRQYLSGFQAALPPIPIEGVAPDLVDAPLLVKDVPFLEHLEDEAVRAITGADPQGNVTLRHVAAWFRDHGMITLEMEERLAGAVQSAIEKGIPVTSDSVVALYEHLALSDDPGYMQDPRRVEEFLEAWPRRREIIERDRGGGGFKEDPHRGGGRRPGRIR